MIVDCNASLGHWPFRRLRDTDPAAFVALMDRYGIAQAWVAPFEALLYKLVGEANEALERSVAGLEDRLVQMGVVNPAFPGWEDDLARCRDRGLPGLRLYPSYHGYALDEEPAVRMLEQVAEAGGVVQVVVRMQDERHHHPLAMVPPVDLTPLRELAGRFPGVPIVVLNAGNAEIQGVSAGGCPANVMFDISHVEGVGGVGILAAQIGVEHLVFGTHSPYLYTESAFLKLHEADLTAPERESILGEAARRIVVHSI